VKRPSARMLSQDVELSGKEVREIHGHHWRRARKSNFVGVGVVVGLRRHVDDESFDRSQVDHRMPHASGNKHLSVHVRTEEDPLDDTSCRRIHSTVPQDDEYLSGNQRVSIVLVEVQSPLLEGVRTDTGNMAEHDGLSPECTRSRVELEHSTPMVHVNSRSIEKNSLDRLLESLAGRVDRLLVANGLLGRAIDLDGSSIVGTLISHLVRLRNGCIPIKRATFDRRLLLRPTLESWDLLAGHPAHQFAAPIFGQRTIDDVDHLLE
jgi:hypothetical protein